MRRTWRIARALGALVVLAAISTGVVLGAVQRATLIPNEAPAGTSATIHVETTARIGGTQPGTLVMLPATAFEASPSAFHCDEIAGAAAVGEMTWRPGAVAFGDSVYDGYVGDATFMVPAVPPGSYHLGENIAAMGTGCHVYAAFEVTAGQLPNTAMPARDVASP